MIQHAYMRDCGCILCSRRRKRRQEIIWLFVALALFLIAGFFIGCTGTVTPAPVTAKQASFDQGIQNSGQLRQLLTGGIISAHARDRYNALIEIYGRDFLPPLQKDDGLTPRADGTYFIINDAWENFILMNRWRAMGRAPGKPNGSTP